MNLMPTPKVDPTYRTLALTQAELAAFWTEEVARIRAATGDDVILSAEEHIRNEQLDQREVSCEAPGCLAGVTFVDIDANMDVLACNCANAFKLGNLNEQSLDEIWNSELADQVRSVSTPLCYGHQEVLEQLPRQATTTVIPVEHLLRALSARAAASVEVRRTSKSAA